MVSLVLTGLLPVFNGRFPSSTVCYGALRHSSLSFTTQEGKGPENQTVALGANSASISTSSINGPNLWKEEDIVFAYAPILVFCCCSWHSETPSQMWVPVILLLRENSSQCKVVLCKRGNLSSLRGGKVLQGMPLLSLGQR